VSWGRVNSRTAWIFVVAVGLFEVLSTIVFLAAAGYSPAVLSDPARLVAVGGSGPDLFRVAALLDMFGYLSAVPVALYLRERFQGQNAIDFFTLAGILFLVLGSLGAAILAFAGAPLIHEYATASSASGKAVAATAFATVHRIVFVAMWQTIDAVVAGVWLLGTGQLAWRQGARRLALVLFAIALAGLLFAVAHVGGFYPEV
jgi:hypothetical protein